jgi:hypothetical protein
VRGDAQAMDARMLDVAQATGIRIFPSLAPTPVPGMLMFELSVAEGAFDIPDDALRAALRTILDTTE